ncbi:MAG: RDD family protein [Acidobacteriota bacterium]|nr:RDD family protein [Acidobacteriota bacterium]
MNPSDKLTIETPEQITLELPLAGIGSRSMAFAFDILLQIGVMAIMAIVASVIVLPLRSVLPGGFLAIATAMLTIVYFLVHWGYFIFFEIRRDGQTPGKRRFQIRVIKESGRPITAMEAIVRNLLRAIDSLPGFYAVGLASMALNKQNRRLGDYAAGTLVVYDKSPGHSHAIWNIWNTGSALPEAVSAPGKLSPEELTLIEAWLNRRSALSAATRRETAAQIASVIRKRTGIEPEDGQQAEDFLESLARRTRDTAGYR